MKPTLKSVVAELEDLFEVFNEKYFEMELSRPVITVSPDNKNRCFGWCTSYKAWKSADGEEGYFEINICAEHLARPFEEVAETMLHEMVHLYNLQNGVKDTSRSGTYHNEKFRAAAEAHGLTCEQDSKYGWCVTHLTDGAKDETEQYMSFIGRNSFDLFREQEPEKEKKEGGKKGNSIKSVCPVCGAIIRATKKVRVICADCDVEFIAEE